MSVDIWRDKGFADAPGDQWMPMLMRDGWESIVDQAGCSVEGLFRFATVVSDLMLI